MTIVEQGMIMRKYTVDEIDQMRELVKNKYVYGRYTPGDIVHFLPHNEAVRHVEDMLRTYILAGIGPEELVDKPE